MAGNQKKGRNKDKCKAYKANGTEAINKAKKATKVANQKAKKDAKKR